MSLSDRRFADGLGRESNLWVQWSRKRKFRGGGRSRGMKNVRRAMGPTQAEKRRNAQ